MGIYWRCNHLENASETALATAFWPFWPFLVAMWPWCIRTRRPVAKHCLQNSIFTLKIQNTTVFCIFKILFGIFYFVILKIQFESILNTRKQFFKICKMLLWTEPAKLWTSFSISHWYTYKYLKKFFCSNMTRQKQILCNMCSVRIDFWDWW